MLSFLSLLGTLAAALGLVLPIALYFATPPFPGRLALTALFLAITIERFWFSLFTSKNVNPVRVAQDWTFVAVGFAYTALMYFVILETYFVRRGRAFDWATLVLGGVLVGASVALRYWAVRHLGKQWAIHVEGTSAEGRKLVTTGPYAYVRHPIYAAAIVEVIGIPLVFNAFLALGFALVACIPLIVIRARFEERNSRIVFGSEYDAYERTTPGLVPRSMKRASG